MPLNVNFYPDRISITPRRVVNPDDDFLKSLWTNKNSLMNLRVKGNPFIISDTGKRRMRDRINSMYLLAVPRTVKSLSGKLIYNFRCSFVTLTLPSVQQHTDKEIKELALNQLLVELRKHYGLNNYVWKAELQKNENIHFHLITDIFIQYQALRKRWNRILEKLGYIKPYTLRMSSMSFEEYFENGKKYNPKLRRTTALDRYKKGMKENWRNPNTVDTRAVKTTRDVAVYMTKYMTKQPTELADDESLLERGSEFGRAWFCSRSLSRLQTYHRMSLSQAQELIDFVYKGENTKEFIGDFFRVIYFRISELGNQFEAWLRGWFLHNAYVSNYIYPT